MALVLSVDKSTVSIGEKATITEGLQNSSEKNIYATFGARTRQVFRVDNVDGRTVLEPVSVHGFPIATQAGDHGMSMVNPGATLKPDNTYRVSFNKAGRYKIRVNWSSRFASEIDAAKVQSINGRSDDLEIRVVAGKPKAPPNFLNSKIERFKVRDLDIKKTISLMAEIADVPIKVDWGCLSDIGLDVIAERNVSITDMTLKASIMRVFSEAGMSPEKLVVAEDEDGVKISCVMK